MDNNPDGRAAWAAEFECWGLYALTKSIYRHMLQYKDKVGNSPPFTEALSFAQRGTSTDQLAIYLGRIKPCVLTAFITGKATAMSYRDTVLEAALQQHSLVNAPVIYLNVVCRRKYLPRSSDGLPNRYAGHSVSVSELKQVLATMKRYIDQQNRANDLIRDIDCAVDKLWSVKPNQPNASGGRKFVPTALSYSKIRDWIDLVEKKVVRQAERDNSNTPEKLDEPMEWCFQEVGFSRSGSKRANQHITQEGTNYLLGLFYATVVYCFEEVFELKQYTWSFVAEPQHANSLEVIGSIVNGTFGFEVGGKSMGIGLNPSMAGGMPMTGPSSLTDPSLHQAFRFAQRQLVKCQDVWLEHLEHIRKCGAIMSDALDKQTQLVDVQREIEVTRYATQQIASDAHQEVKKNLLSAVAALRARPTQPSDLELLAADSGTEQEQDANSTLGDQ